jgi:hypothetical protein
MQKSHKFHFSRKIKAFFVRFTSSIDCEIKIYVYDLKYFRAHLPIIDMVLKFVMYGCYATIFKSEKNETMGR